MKIESMHDKPVLTSGWKLIIKSSQASVDHALLHKVNILQIKYDSPNKIFKVQYVILYFLGICNSGYSPNFKCDMHST